MMSLRAVLLTSIIVTSSIANPNALDQAAIDACAGAVGGVKCLSGGTRFVNCNADRSVSQAVADGQRCEDGRFVFAAYSQAAIWRSIVSVAQNLGTISAAAVSPLPSPSTPSPNPVAPGTLAPPPPASKPSDPPSSSSSKAPDPCFLGGQVLQSDMQDDSCKGADGSIECRTEYMYVRCNVGKIARCRSDKGHKCFKNKLSNTYQA